MGNTLAGSQTSNSPSARTANVAKSANVAAASVMAGTLAAVGLVAAMITVVWRPEPRLPSMASIEQWTAPTDFLLETPGRQLLETVPLIGTTPSLPPLEGVTGSGPPTKRRSTSP